MAKPAVFRVTVFPPALGPVIIKPRLVESKLSERGTGLDKRGCLISFNWS